MNIVDIRIMYKRLLIYILFLTTCCDAFGEKSTFAFSEDKQFINSIVNVKVLEPEKNLSQQVNCANTVYIFRNVFELDTDFVMPSNCVLQFEGGGICGKGVIEGHNTSIVSTPYEIFSNNIEFKGSWIAPTACPEWFGAKGDGITDDTKAVQNILSYFDVNGNGKTYAVSNLSLRGGNVKNIFLVFIGLSGSVLSAEKQKDFVLEKVVVDGNNRAECCLLLNNCEKVAIEQSDFFNINSSGPNYIHGIYINRSEFVNINNCRIHDIYAAVKSSDKGGASRGIAAVNSIFVKIESCELYNIAGSIHGGCGDAIQLIAQTRFGYEETESNNIVRDCVFYNNNYRHIKIQQYGCIVENNLIRVGTTEPKQSCIAIYDCFCRCIGNTINSVKSIPILVGAINNDLSVFRDIQITGNIIKTKLEENSAIFLSNCELIEKINIINNICTCENGCNFLNVRTNIKNLICAHNNVEGCLSLVNIRKGTIKHDSTFVRDNILIEGNVIKNLGNFIVYLDEDKWCENIVIVGNIGIALSPSKITTFKNSFAGPNNLSVTKKNAHVNGNIINADYTDGSVK